MSSLREQRLRQLLLLLLLSANQLSQWAWSQPASQKVSCHIHFTYLLTEGGSIQEAQGDRRMSLVEAVEDIIKLGIHLSILHTPPSHAHFYQMFTPSHVPHTLLFTPSPTHTSLTPSENPKLAPLTSSLSVFDPFKPATPTSTQQPSSSSNMTCKHFIVGSWQEENISYCYLLWLNPARNISIQLSLSKKDLVYFKDLQQFRLHNYTLQTVTHF